MKLQSVSAAALALAAPLLMILSLLMPLACGSSSSSTTTSSTPQPTGGNVEIGLVDAPSLGFQNILLNVISVRLNPANNATDATSGWVPIPAPAGVGGPLTGPVVTNTSTGGSFFNTNNPETNPGTSELQIDLNTLQNNVMIFNTAGVPPQIYRTVQLKIDSNVPGSIVPNCASVSPPATEGCISFPVNVASPAALATSTEIPVKNGQLTTLVLDIALPQPVPPNSNGGKYSIAPQISLIPNAGSSPSVNSLMALLQGSVSGIPSGVQENVTVEPAGTSNQIATAKVKGGKYVMQVPVATSGTSYDLFAFGAGNSYDLITPVQPAPAQPLTRGTSYIVNFAVKSAQTGKLTGTIFDGCVGSGASRVEGATIDLLASSDGTDCTIVPTPTNCAVVASTSTNVLGNYPTAGRTGLPQPFNFVPASNNLYAIRVSASGFDTTVSPVKSAGGKVTCPNTANQKCDFSLTHSFITGVVSISPASGTTAEVQVFAEPTGTNDIVSALPAPLSIPACGSPPCLEPFTINVPTALTAASYDLFATSVDLFNGNPDPYTSHQYAAISGVTTPAECSAAFAGDLALMCAGHGSIAGTVALPDDGTTVRLFKGGVQVEQTTVAPPGSNLTTAGAYSFCAPGDTYGVQRFENGAPAGPTMAVTVPTPDPTATPCLQCTNGGVCPGNCANTDGPPL